MGRNLTRALFIAVSISEPVWSWCRDKGLPFSGLTIEPFCFNNFWEPS